MAYTKTIRTSTGHTMHVQLVPAEALPEHLRDSENFDRFYVVRNWDAKGVVFFYLGKGHPLAPRQVCGWYRHSGSLWASYGDTIEAAVEGLIRDGWQYA